MHAQSTTMLPGPVNVYGKTLSLDVRNVKQLIIFTGNIDTLPLFNEYTLNPERLNIETPVNELTDTLDVTCGLQNMIKPYICLYDPAKHGVSYYIFSKKPLTLNITSDTNDNITNLLFTFSYNTYVVSGHIRLGNFITDSNSDLIPDFVDKITSVLDRNKYVQDWYYQYDLSGTSILTNDFNITLNDIDITPFTVPQGDTVWTIDKTLLPVHETITTSSGNLSVYDVKGLNTILYKDTPYTNTGTCKIWDTVTTGSIEGWTRIFDINHIITGDCVLDNEFINIKISPGASTVSKKYIGETIYSNLCDFGILTVSSFTIDILSIDVIKVSMTLSDNSVHTIKIQKGYSGCWVDYPTCIYFISDTAQARFYGDLTDIFIDTSINTGIDVNINSFNKSIVFGIAPTGSKISYFVTPKSDVSVHISYPIGSIPSDEIYIGIIAQDCSKLYTDSTNMEGGESI